MGQMAKILKKNQYLYVNKNISVWYLLSNYYHYSTSSPTSVIPSLHWLSLNLLHLNPGRTEALVFSPTVSLKRSVITSARLRAISDLLLRRLVLFLTSIWTLNLTSQSTSSFFHLKNITKIKPLLSSSNSELLVHTLIFSRLDYCDSLFTWISLSLSSPPELVFQLFQKH